MVEYELEHHPDFARVVPNLHGALGCHVAEAMSGREERRPWGREEGDGGGGAARWTITIT